mgnify:CR=1 FL=1
MRFRSALVILGLIALPLSASAVEVTTWDFTDGQVPGQWNVKEITSAAPTAEGLRVRTDTSGLMWRDIGETGGFDSVTLIVTSPKDITARLIWHRRGDETNLLTPLDFTIPKSSGPQKIHIAPEGYSRADPHADELGLSFAAGTDILIHAIQLERWSTGEKFMNALKSFWTPDEFRPYAINFLWGPLLAFTPTGRDQLFQRLPPLAASAVRLFYGLILLAGIGGIVAVFFARGNERVRRGALATFACLLIGLWLLFDLRMGGEILSYVRSDFRTHVLPDAGQKTLRTHGSFYDVAATVLPELRKEERYALITDSDSPIYSNLRYMSYPSLPLVPGNTVTNGLQLLFVYDRPDIRFVNGSLLNPDGTNLATNGHMLMTRGSGTYLYRAN